MRTLSDHEQRTIRIAGILIAVYLLLFGGWRGWAFLATKRHDYQNMIKEAKRRKQQLEVYQDKAAKIKELMEKFHMDPAKLSRASVVAEASDAIQKAGASGGVQFGPIRESHGHSSAKELASMQLEGNGSLPSVVTLLNRLESLGYPVIVDAVQITPNAMRPGMVKVTLTILIMDFEAWKSKEAPNA
jgi:hypothetical protein